MPYMRPHRHCLCVQQVFVTPKLEVNGGSVQTASGTRKNPNPAVRSPNFSWTAISPRPLASLFATRRKRQTSPHQIPLGLFCGVYWSETNRPNKDAESMFSLNVEGRESRTHQHLSEIEAISYQDQPAPIPTMVFLPEPKPEEMLALISALGATRR